MLHRTIIVLTLLAAIGVTYALAGAPDGVITVSTSAFEPLTRPAAAFAHDEHNEKAGIDDCAACHHGEIDGKQTLEETSEGTPCADCHALTVKDDRTPLKRAYHRQCMGCHKTTGKGPANCGGCHKPWPA
ncbi:acidic tetraheme cytochrome c3 TmcA [Oleidesulfovibrio sp.]|uniref:acidic tetraheme cytochrome c3 TmcA n=1 Tax=Oleidesulfovibrio sp. TaxID=2909707 RepID=UPI003A85E926